MTFSSPFKMVKTRDTLCPCYGNAHQRIIPKAQGSILAVDSEGQSIGSVSAGCVEGYIIERCLDVVKTGIAEICEFGAALPDEPSLFDIGLSCHGKMEILTQISPNDQAFRSWLNAACNDRETVYYSHDPAPLKAPKYLRRSMSPTLSTTFQSSTRVQTSF